MHTRLLKAWAGAALAAIGASACGARPETATTIAVPADPASYANVSAFVAKHLVWNVTADFASKTLAGTAELHLVRREDASTELVLDTRDLQIHEVQAAIGSGTWTDTTFTLDSATPAFGSALRIVMPPGADRVKVQYSTSPAAKGLQWLAPEQTAGKARPFMFSQAQAIQARSFVPLQDLPGVRFTYDATIRTPRKLVAVMAAEMKPASPGSGVYQFHMPQPIPSYLVAIAIGDLVFQPMSERTGVWAEPSVVRAAAREFEDTEKMIQTAEKLYGPYRWGRFDLLVLPPSFPFGGMENPRLTFATPTILAGDKSLVSLVAHELAHSWSGNLVTNATWSDFWLNEGVTTYIERRIVEAVYGKPRADMEALIGMRDLEDSRKTLEVGRDRTLVPDLTGRDPDDAFSTVPYEQGALFLTFLEARFGRNVFDRFLRAWFDKHAFASVTTADVLAAIRRDLLPTKPGAVTEAELQEWLTSEVVPAFAVTPESTAFENVERVRDAWLGGGSIDALAAVAAAWSTQEWLRFVDTLPRTLDRARMSALDARFALTRSQNAEIAHAWFRLAIATRFTPAHGAMEDYMMRIGRRKLILPLYRDLAATPEGLVLARRTYAAARPAYHPLTQGSIDDVLKQ
jgi:leukotriene A-4 hydrolase/aminopeptidase